MVRRGAGTIMCFSATASFTAAAVMGGVGVVTVYKTAASKAVRVLPFAAVPLLFAAQQLIEGFLWLEIAEPVAGSCRPVLIHGFVGYAQVFWPAFAPLAALLIEPDQLRRRPTLACLVCGIVLAGWLARVMIAHPYSVTVHEDGLVYRNGFDYPWFMWPVYVLATTLSFSFSSHREVRMFSLVVLAGLAVAAILFNRAYVSVWCFFAAAASVLVYIHISRMKARAAVGSPHQD